MEEKRFRGPIAVLGAALVMFCSFGICMVVSSTFVSYAEKFNVSLTTVSGCTAPCTVAAFCGYLIAPVLLKKWGGKKTFYLGIFCVAAYCLIMAFAQNVLWLYVGEVFAGLMQAFSNHAVVTLIVSNWYIKKRGKMLGTIFAASALGGACFVKIGGAIMGATGDPSKLFLYLGMVVIPVALIANTFLVIEKPEVIGQKAYGSDDPEALAAVGMTQNKGTEKQDKKGVLALPQFWVSVVAIIAIATAATMNTYMPTYFQKIGFSAQEAADRQFFVLLLGILSGYIVGFIRDKFGLRPVAIFLFGCLIIGCGLCVVGLTNVSNGLIVAIILFIGLSFSLSSCISHFVDPIFGIFATSANALLNGIFQLTKAFTIPGCAAIMESKGLSTFLYLMIVAAALSVVLLFAALAIGQKYNKER